MSWTIAELEALTFAGVGQPRCDTFWGSHGCARPPQHDLPHVCGTPADRDGLCSIHDGDAVQYVVFGDEDGEVAAPGQGVDRRLLDETRYPNPTFSIGHS